MKVDEYRINPKIETGGTHRFSEVKLKPIELLLVFKRMVAAREIASAEPV